MSEAIATKVHDFHIKCPSEGLRTGVKATAYRSNH